MKLKDTLNRFGDTSFRIKNQTAFYTQILLKIYNEENISPLKLFEYIENEGIIKYSKNDKLGRQTLLTKQLKYFGLVDFNLNQELICTDFAKNFLDQISTLNYINGYNIFSVFWFYIMLYDINLSNLFKGFIIYLHDHNIELLSNELIYFFISSPKEIYIDKPNNLDNDYNESELLEILKYNNMHKVFKFRKIPKYNSILPELVNSLDDESKVVKILNNDNKLVSIIKKIMINYYNYSKKITPNELMNFLYNNKNNIIFDYKKFVSDQTIKKDYKDINCRWFNEINLFTYHQNKKMIINKEYLNLYYKIVNQFDLISSSENPFSELIKIIKESNELVSELKYPFNNEQINEILKLCINNDWLLIKKLYPCFENIANPTIFEYMINLTFSYYLNFTISKFIDSTNTILDAQLLPTSHAPGKKPDYETNYNNLYFIVESTLLKSNEEIMKNEFYSTQRHSYKFFEDVRLKTNTYINKEPFTILIFNEELNDNLIYNFMNYSKSEYFSDPNIIIKTLIINTKILLDLVNSNKFPTFLEYIYKNIPLNGKNEIIDEYNNILNNFLK